MAISNRNICILNASCPCPCPPVPPEEIQLYDSFQDAVVAVNNIRLRPGDSHVEFYKSDTSIHCVIGIGNIDLGKAHLILTDTGDAGSIGELLAKLTELIKNLLSEVSTNKAEYLAKMVDISNNLDSINSSIEELRNGLNELYITDSSIDSLFKDIYTVNLCCYTKGGYVIVPDYSTYIGNETIKLEALPNTGYQLSCWYKDNSILSYNSSIFVTFENEDINVIGTTATKKERSILEHGYTALFSKMLSINVSICVEMYAELSGDTILINHSELKYVKMNDNVLVEAVPVEHHDFIKMIINGTEITDSSIILANVANDISIVGYFKERRYIIDVAENDRTYGRGIGGGIKLEGTKEIISAIPNDGYKFSYWTYKSKDGDIPNIVVANPLEIEYDNDYEYIAYFTEI